MCKPVENQPPENNSKICTWVVAYTRFKRWLGVDFHALPNWVNHVDVHWKHMIYTNPLRDVFQDYMLDYPSLGEYSMNIQRTYIRPLNS